MSSETRCSPNFRQAESNRTDSNESFRKIRSLNWSNLFYKIFVIVYVAYTSIRGHAQDIFILYEIPLMQAIMLCGTVIINAGLKISLVYLVIGLADFIYQKYRFNEDMKMTKQEVKDEFKNTEGNPEIKGRQRQRMREASRRRNDAGCSKSGRCHHEPDSLCSCDRSMMLRHQRHRLFLQREKIILAQKIKEAAREHHIEIVENKPLARMLYAQRGYRSRKFRRNCIRQLPRSSQWFTI